MNATVESRSSSSITFALLQKGKSVLVKVNYDSVGDMLLAQKAWQQVQQEHAMKADGDASASAETGAVLAPASTATDVDRDSVPLDDIAAALKHMKPPEWHKNGATLRLPEGHSNASLLLAAVVRVFDSCVQKQLARAEELSIVASALPPRHVHAMSVAASQHVASLEQQQSKPMSTAERRALLLAPCELIEKAEAIGLQRLQRLRRCNFPFERQDLAALFQKLAPTPHPMLLRVLCICAPATAAARLLVSAPPEHWVSRDLQFSLVAAILRRVFWGCRCRIRVCFVTLQLCLCLFSCHACRRKTWKSSRFAASASLWSLVACNHFDHFTRRCVSCLTRSLQAEAAARLAKARHNNINIHSACSKGDVNVVEDFIIVDRSCLKQKHECNGYTGTPFNHACSAGQLPVVEAILALKADVNDADVVGDALAGASKHGHIDVVQALLSLGMNVNAG